MNGNCIEIGTIQAFLDGETGPDVSLRVSSHIADCDRCASVLAHAEEETSAVFAALDREMNTLVPTQRLWSRINETITEEKNSTSVLQRAIGFISAAFASPSLASAFGLLIVFALGVAVLVYNPGLQDPIQPTDVAQSPVTTEVPPQVVNIATTGSSDVLPGPEAKTTASVSPSYVGESKLSPEKLRRLVVNADFNARPAAPRAQNADYRPASNLASAYLPGEESYVKTIAELKQNVDGQKDAILSPSSRVSYERDMAVVNDSIRKMRDVVRKNPKNQAAKQVLYASYQDKIDLLNSVAQREDLVASLR